MKKTIIAATIAAFSSAAFAQFTEAWHATYNGEASGYDGAFAVATDKRGNTYITGQTANPTTATDYVTIKYSPTGAQLWKRYYNATSDEDGADIAHAIAVDNDGNVYVTGESQIGPSNPYSYYGFATIKYDTNGNPLWTRRLDYAATDCKAVDLAINANGDVFVTGTKQPLSGSTDYLTVRYDTNGNQQLGWPVAYDSGGADEAVAIAVGPGDDVYVTGQSLI
jgi:hypothetical protein